MLGFRKLPTVFLFTSSLLMSPSIYADEGVEHKGLFSFVAPLLMDTLTNVVTALVHHGESTIFSYLNGSQVENTEEREGAESESQGDSQSEGGVSNVLSREQAEVLARQPLFAVSVYKFDSSQVDTNPIEKIKFKFGDELGFSIQTGEYFAIKFDTSTPGEVRLINTDSNGKVEDVGFYEVIGTAENRMPRNTNILMYGDTGLETLDIEFIACVSEKSAADPRVAPYVGVLPACMDVGKGTKKYKAEIMKRVSAKGMHNTEADTNSTVALMAASPEVSTSVAEGVEVKHTIRLNVNHIKGS